MRLRIVIKDDYQYAEFKRFLFWHHANWDYALEILKKHPDKVKVINKSKKHKAMKYFFIFLITTLCLRSDAQPYAQFAAGLSTTHSLTVNPALSWSIHKFFLQAEIASLINNDQPVYFGMSAGYHFSINDHVSIEPAVGRYYEYFSEDKYDAYKNRWRYMYALKVFYNKVFLQLQVAHISILSLGFKEEFK